MIVLVASVILAGCGSDATCPPGYAVPIVIEVRTTEGEPAAEGAEGVAIQDGQEYPLVPEPSAPHLKLALSENVDGFFEVRLEREGFEPWVREKVYVEERPCGARDNLEILAILTPEEAP